MNPEVQKNLLQNNNFELLPNERLDDLERDGLYIIQNPTRFCFGIDAVLLSDFVEFKNGAKILDMGTGTGIIPLLLSKGHKSGRTPGFIDALEIQKTSADSAIRSVRGNNLSHLIKVTEGDLCSASEIYGHNKYDVVTINPPYMKFDNLQNATDDLTISRHEVKCTLEDICRESARVLKFNGHLFMIHKPERLAEIFEQMMLHHLEPKKLRFVHPYVDKPPTMVLIDARLGGNHELKTLPPLIVYKEKNVYSDEILKIYGK